MAPYTVSLIVKNRGFEESNISHEIKTIRKKKLKKTLQIIYLSLWWMSIRKVGVPKKRSFLRDPINCSFKSKHFLHRI